MVTLRLLRSAFATLLCAGTAAHAQQAFPLLAPATQAVANPAQDAVLATAENRARLAALMPNGPNGTIDLSQPLSIELFPDVHVTVQLQRVERPAPRGLEIWEGRVPDARFDHLPHYRNTLFVLNRNTGKLVADIGLAQGYFQLLPTRTPGIYRVRDCKLFGNERCGVQEPLAAPVHPGAPRPAHGAEGGPRGLCGNPCNEADADGRYVIDVFAGYSESAAAVAGDLDAHAMANLETVNMGLANSLVDTVYLRLVGTGVTPHNPGIVTPVLDSAWTWFAPQITDLAPDLIAVFQTPTNDPGSAGGWGGVPGRTTVNGVEWPTVFRHEAGHNAGGNHCYPDNDNFRNGFDNGHWRTHLCGNDENFYSTPLVNDDLGNPIGDPDQADMARQWTETARTMANYGMHRVPYFEGDTCVDQPCLPSHWGDPIEYISRVQFNTLDNVQADPAWNCPSVTGYSDYADLSTDVEQGSTHDLIVESTASWEESTMRAWIDWNRDGIISAGEKVMDLIGLGPWSMPVTAPGDAVPGPALMRIRLQYGLDNPADPCNGSGYSSGESEDYTVHILTGSPAGMGDPDRNVAAIRLFPNPAGHMITVQTDGFGQGPLAIRILNVAGQEVLVRRTRPNGTAAPVMLEIGHLPAGVYALEMRDAASTRSVRFVKE